MYFEFVKEAAAETEDELAEQYQALYSNLEKAEQLYWKKPQQSGMMLRKAAEKVCRIYNRYYKIGFAEDALLEAFLCYTGDDNHNAMVSRFLSTVRQEQRDHLEWLRVWGDECIFMEANPDEIACSGDKLYLNVKKMMSAMLYVTENMCTKINHMEFTERQIFDDSRLPDYPLEEAELQKKAGWKKGLFATLFRK